MLFCFCGIVLSAGGFWYTPGQFSVDCGWDAVLSRDGSDGERDVREGTPLGGARVRDGSLREKPRAQALRNVRQAEGGDPMSRASTPVVRELPGRTLRLPVLCLFTDGAAGQRKNKSAIANERRVAHQ